VREKGERKQSREAARLNYSRVLFIRKSRGSDIYRDRAWTVNILRISRG